MFNSSRYKRSQGRMARQLTFFAIAATAAIGAWRLSEIQFGRWLVPEAVQGFLSPMVFAKYLFPAVVLALGVWAAFRIVNIPRFADFLISVEAEMNKVSWPSRAELWRASMVVIVVIFLLTAILFGYDFLLRMIVRWLLGVEAQE
jgi:preprotein translocase subunit SecE